MPFIKRYDTLACEILTNEEIVNSESEKKDDKNQIKEDENKEEMKKVNELAELIIFT